MLYEVSQKPIVMTSLDLVQNWVYFFADALCTKFSEKTNKQTKLFVINWNQNGNCYDSNIQS